ncbi:MotA/TolQ/ExbB proton channel family protein [Roseateles sp. So40a]|uniref:MotA/TolQ/ExbB proton channel family protein n=1 Tax=Roseateles sp. So40a TaxID=3400226 RepID=UPI003A86B72E
MFSIIQAAGWPIWPLLLCSVVALALIIERVVSLRAARVAPPSLIEEVLGVTQLQIPSGEVVGKLAENSLLGQVLAAGLRASQADPRAGETRLRQVFELAGRHAIHQMERYLNTLGTIAAAAPLLGLLGTVVGMIEIFGSQSPTGNNPGLLAHGISIALYNTAFGLVVAIPSLMFYRYFRGRIEGYIVDMEQASERLLTHLVNRAMPTGAHAGGNGGPVTVPPPVAAPAPGKAKA